jgi:hypothetical protein
MYQYRAVLKGIKINLIENNTIKSLLKHFKKQNLSELVIKGIYMDVHAW